MLAKIHILIDYEYVFYSFVFHKTLIDEPLRDPLDTSTNVSTSTPNPTTSDSTNNHTTAFTVSSSRFPTPPMCNCRTFKHLIPEIGSYPCVAPEGFQWRPKWELFPVDVPSSSTAATSSANKCFEELFLDRVKPNPTKKDKGKSKWASSRAQVRKLLPNKCNVGVILLICVVSKQYDFYLAPTLDSRVAQVFFLSILIRT